MYGSLASASSRLVDSDQRRSAISVRGLRKRYGQGVEAVDALLGIDLNVAEGEVVGILGPNGAGKTTLVEILEGIRAPDAGTVEILGARLEDAQSLKARRGQMGVSLQHSVLPPLLTVVELLTMQRDLFGSSTSVDELVDRVDLAEKRSARVGKLSGGQQQRVAVAMALIGDPKLMFLDEPTSQLDPQARRTIWEAFGLQRERGATILITTHQMEEAERICDRVVILDGGRIVAQGTPADLVDRYCPERRVEFIASRHASFDFVDQPMVCVPLPGESVRISVQTGDPGQLITELVRRSSLPGGEFRQLRLEQATLEDVFIKLTGREVQPS